MSQPSYAAILRDSESAWWSLEAAAAGLVDLDFEQPFFPEPLVHAERLPFLTAGDRVVLSQLRARSYLGLAVLAEKFILPFVMSQGARCFQGDSERFLALMGYCQQAAKHIALFERFAAAFERGFGSEHAIVGPVEDINARFLTNDTLAIGLLVLHCECSTQTHHLRAARGGTMAEPFKQLLRLHWREEAQNATLGTLILAELTNDSAQHERERAVQGYLGMLDDFSAVYRQQVELDIEGFERAARSLSEDERAQWRAGQTKSYEEVFLRHGLEHKLLRQTIVDSFGARLEELDVAARGFAVPE